MNYTAILEEIYSEVKPLVGEGHIADYIPELAHISPNKFGMAVQAIDGERFTIGDAAEKFSIQSISKVFTLLISTMRWPILNVKRASVMLPWPIF